MADPAVFPLAGYTAVLDALTDGLLAYVHLYTNDLTPDINTTLGDFVEIVMTGYAPLPIKRWTPAAMYGDLAYSWGDPAIFEYTAGGLPLPVRGYWLTAGIAGPLLWAVRRSAGGFQFTVNTPRFVVGPRLIFPLVC